ncbi:hypothetical protein HZB90_01995 [archaeon]|nr:hypothetical protein [archaeon]
MGDVAELHDLTARRRELAARGGEFATKYAERKYTCGQDDESEKVARDKIQGLEKALFGETKEGEFSFLERIAATPVPPETKPGQKDELTPEQKAALQKVAYLMATDFSVMEYTDCSHYDSKQYRAFLNMTLVYYHLFDPTNMDSIDRLHAVAGQLQRHESGLPRLLDPDTSPTINRGIGKVIYNIKEKLANRKEFRFQLTALRTANKILTSANQKEAAIAYFSS